MAVSSMDVTFNDHKRAWQCALVVTLAYLFFAYMPDAYAATTPSDTFDVFKTFLGKVKLGITNLMASGSDSMKTINAMFISLGTYRIGLAVILWMNDKNDLIDILGVVALVSIVLIMIEFYNPATSATFEFTDGIGISIQKALTGSGDMFLIPDYIFAVVNNISVPMSVWDALSSFSNLLMLGVITLVMIMLSILGLVGMAWASWGFALAKMIGIFTVPLILLPATRGFFDGWVRFFMGFLIYGIVIRTNLALVALLLSVFFNVPISETPGAKPMVIDPDDWADMVGLLALLVVAYISIVSTGKFASALAGSIGFGDNARAVGNSTSAINSARKKLIGI